MSSLPLIISRHASGAAPFLENEAVLSGSFTLRVVEDASTLRSAILEAAETSDLVVVGGGDGTVSCAARLLACTTKTLEISEWNMPT